MTSWLEHQGLKSLRREAKRSIREAVSEIKQHITYELEIHMATITEALDRLAADIAAEIQQVRDGLAATVANLTTENEGLRAELQAQVDALDAAVLRVEGMSADLQANDPPAEPPVEP